MRKLLLIFTFLGAVHTLSAQETDVLDSVPEILADDPVMARLDELVQQHWLEADGFTIDTLLLNIYGYPMDSIPDFSDEVYRERLSTLDKRSPMDLRYNNIIRSYINVYTKRKRELTSRVMGLSELYFPLFEETLDRYEMPIELKYLAVVESALNASARSRAGASGLWQFMYGTGKEHGLRIDSYVDERLDPIASTDAACRYLRRLHGIYNDWNLALAAYNCGPGNVNKAMRRSGAHDYWSIYNYLPRETRGYVPAFVAVNYVMSYAAEHNLYPIAPAFRNIEVDTLEINFPVTFAQISKFTGVAEETLVHLNPSFKQGIVPDMDEPVHLTLPTSIIGKFQTNEAGIANYHSPQAVSAPSEPAASAAVEVKTDQLVHRVKSGEVLGTIARRYGVSVSNVMAWNGLRNSRIRVGQKLTIHANAPAQLAQKPVAPTENPASQLTATTINSKGYVYHTIEKGDTLWDIANKYPGVSVQQLKDLNQGVNFKRLYPGKKIKIRAQG